MILQLPYGLAAWAFWWLSKKLTFTFSGMPGARKDWSFGETKVYSLTCFIPSVGDMQVGITQYSAEKTMTVGLATDTHQIQDPDLFMDLINKNYHKFMYPEAQK